MYSEWASLQHEIQCDKANQSVLHKYPEAVGKEVACSVVKHIAKNFSVSVINADLSSLENDRDIKWTMEVLCFGLSLPLTEHDAIRDCVNIYCEWLSALTKPSEFVPKPLIDNPNHYAQEIIHHLLNLFVPRAGSGVDLVKRQALLCHRVLRTIETISADSSILTRDMWETFLKFLLAANDSLLSPPAEKDDAGLSSRKSVVINTLLLLYGGVLPGVACPALDGFWFTKQVYPWVITASICTLNLCESAFRNTYSFFI